MQLTKDFDKVTWYGRGPFENYTDRKTAAFVAKYSSTPDQMYVPYVRPQENGQRTDVRWLTLENSSGSKISFISQEGLFQFSSLYNSQQDFDPGEKKGQRHTYDIKPRDQIYLNIDMHQMGLGGDNSWGAWPHEQYTLPAKEYSYSFVIKIE